MKKIYLLIVILALSGNVQQASAQSFLDKLGSAASSLLQNKEKTGNTVSALTDIASKLLGKKDVSVASLQGTWTYNKPCVAFESENVLTSIGGVAASSKIENSLDAALTKVGFTGGRLQLTLNADSTGCVTTTSGKKVQFTWSVNKADMTLTFPIIKKTVHMNVKQSLGSLQLALNAEKLLTLATAISEKASTVNSTAAGINSMIKDVKGLYVGLKFTKKTDAKN